MYDPSFDATVNDVKGNLYNSTIFERDWWNKAGTESKISILKNSTDIFTASENAYQQDYTAKFDQLVNTKYDSLPTSVKNSITESLIVLGELPDPSDFNGIGLKYAIEGELCLECDRCDESFMSTEDFDTHKKFDHGDNNEDFDEAEESLTYTMNPEIDRHAFKEARKAVTETDQGDLHRKVYFNADQIPQPTTLEPESDGDVGYNDNPNEGLYDTKRFKKGNSADRYDGQVTEAYDPDGDRKWWDSLQDYQRTKYAGDADVQDVPYDQLSPAEQGELGSYWDYNINHTSFEDMTSSHESHGNPSPQDWWEEEGWKEDDNGLSTNWNELSREDQDRITSNFNAMVDEDPTMFTEADNFKQKEKSNFSDWDDDLKGLQNDYQNNSEEVNYDQSGVSDIRMVAAENNDPAKALKDLDFSEEKIDFVYQTKAAEAFVEENDPFLEGYGDDDINSDEAAVENQIISRKLHGYNDESIATELVMQYGIPREEALEKSYGVEVSVNDKVANTFFGKLFKECTESEKTELKLYGGSE